MTTPTVPGYQIMRELGKGGMGMVYLAKRESDDTQVALKILPPHLITPITARRFQREGKALQGTDHPHIVRVYDVGAKDGQHFIAMEYVAGAPLSKLLRDHKKGLPLAVATRYATQMASALRCIHERGMTHRDLKPGNVMLSASGEIKLLDFGLVQVEGLTMLTATGNIVGTPRYMSPEQCAGVPLDSRSDIYSFGVMLYELLTGKAPFESDNIYDLLEQQKTQEPIAPRKHRKDIPEQMEQLVLHCLKKAAEERPQTMREVLAVLSPADSEAPAYPSGTLMVEAVAPLSGTFSTATPTATSQSVDVGAVEETPGGNRMVRAGVFGLLIMLGGVIALFSIPHPKVEALRHRVTEYLPFLRGPLKDSVEHQYETLLDAENAYSEGQRLQSRGNKAGAYNAYLSAHQGYPTEVRYIQAIVSLAEDVGRVDEAKGIVGAYLETPNADDPGGLLATWLEEKSP